MSEHAFLAPSSAARWVRCALSASLEAAYPETEPSQSSLEGTAAHWAVQMLLQGTPVAIDTQAPNGVAVTLEMLQAAELVRDDIYRGTCRERLDHERTCFSRAVFGGTLGALRTLGEP